MLAQPKIPMDIAVDCANIEGASAYQVLVVIHYQYTPMIIGFIHWQICAVAMCDLLIGIELTRGVRSIHYQELGVQVTSYELRIRNQDWDSDIRL